MLSVVDCGWTVVIEAVEVGDDNLSKARIQARKVRLSKLVHGAVAVEVQDKSAAAPAAAVEDGSPFLVAELLAFGTFYYLLSKYRYRLGTGFARILIRASFYTSNEGDSMVLLYELGIVSLWSQRWHHMEQIDFGTQRLEQLCFVEPKFIPCPTQC
jgi:hypothetical protein